MKVINSVFVGILLSALLAVSLAQEAENEMFSNMLKGQATSSTLGEFESHIHKFIQDSSRSVVVAFTENSPTVTDFHSLANEVQGAAGVLVVPVATKSHPSLSEDDMTVISNGALFRVFDKEGETQDFEDSSKIAAYLLENVEPHLRPVPLSNGEVMEQFLVGSVNLGRFPVVFFVKQDKMPQLLKKVAAGEPKFMIGAFLNPDESLVNQFRVPKVPHAMVMVGQRLPDGELRFGGNPFPGKGINFGSVTLWLNQIAGSMDFEKYFSELREAPTASENESPEVDEFKASDRELTQIENVEEWQRVLNFKTGVNIIVLVDGCSAAKEETEGYLSLIRDKVMAHKTIRDSAVSFSWVDSLCHNEIGDGFGISGDMLPSVIALRSKSEKYSNLVGAFNSQNIVKLINSAQANRQMKPIKVPDFEEKDCALFHAQGAVSDDSAADAEMEEFLAELRRKEAEEEARIEAELAEELRQREEAEKANNQERKVTSKRVVKKRRKKAKKH